MWLIAYYFASSQRKLKCSKKNKIFLLGMVLLAVSLGILVSQIYPAKANAEIPDTPDAKQIMAVMNKAYQVLGRASQASDISELPDVFIDTEDYKLTDQQQEIVAASLGLGIAEVENAGYLTAMQAKYISRAQGAKLLQAALEIARTENRNLTSTEIQEIIRSNNGQWPSGSPITTNKTILTFESIEVNGDKAIVRYDDGAALQEAILVKKAGRWFIASIVPIWVHY